MCTKLQTVVKKNTAMAVTSLQGHKSTWGGGGGGVVSRGVRVAAPFHPRLNLADMETSQDFPTFSKLPWYRL